MRPRKHIVQREVTLTRSDDQIMRGAAHVGTWNGRDDDWFPTTLDEAIMEIIEFSDAPAEYGVEI